MTTSTIRAVSGLLALGVVSSALDAAVLSPSAQSRTRPALSRTKPAVELRLRRTPGQLDVVIGGLGTEVRAVSQSQSDSRWSARLTGVDLGNRPFTPQQTVLSSSELLSVRLEPLESDLQLIVKARMGERVPTPTIGSDGDALVVSFAGLTGPEQRSSGRLDLRRPGRVAQPVMAPPMRPRASAPPLGDIAVGTMLINNRSFVKASGPPVSLTLNKSPAKDALMSLARLGGYGFIFVDDADGVAGSGGNNSEYPVTMSFKNESYDRALNSVLMASGLQGRLDRNTLLVGTAVSAKSFGPQMSKVFRMNQVDVASANQYLGNLGASITVSSTTTVTSTDGGENSGSGGSSVTASTTISDVDTYGSGVGPLIGLIGTTDSRLNTITLIGDPKLISVAESYLRQIDLRKRQVAVKIQILNVSLENDTTIDSSFSAKIGNTFIVSKSGKAHINFGKYKPGVPSTRDDPNGGTGIYNGNQYSTPGEYSRFFPKVQAQDMRDPVVAAQEVQEPYVESKSVNPAYVVAKKEVTNTVTDGAGNRSTETTFVDVLDAQGRPVYILDTNPNAPQTLVPRYDSQGRPIYVPDTNPNSTQTLVPRYDDQGRPVYVPDTNPVSARTGVPRFDEKGRPVYVDANDPNKFSYPDNSFYSYIESVVVSSNAKTLAQPTLLVQEGESATIRSGQSVITGRDETVAANGSTTSSNTREDAGLTVNLEVEKIDDNGFITLNLEPTISVPVSAGFQGGIQIFDIVERTLDSGRIRLRDQQTLILTGVIQESDRQLSEKWPILGDLPLVGQLFRKSSTTRQKDELVIIVTPSIIDDEGGSNGYLYRAGTAAGRDLVRQKF